MSRVGYIKGGWQRVSLLGTQSFEMEDQDLREDSDFWGSFGYPQHVMWWKLGYADCSLIFLLIFCNDQSREYFRKFMEIRKDKFILMQKFLKSMLFFPHSTCFHEFLEYCSITWVSKKITLYSHSSSFPMLSGLQSQMVMLNFGKLTWKGLLYNFFP